MQDIFTNWIAMDCFCYDIVEAWMAYREQSGKPYDEDSYLEWLEDDFIGAMECAYKDCAADHGMVIDDEASV